jgi:hypothetical protein
MGQVHRLVLGSLILLTMVGPGRAAERRFSCKGDIVQGEPTPIRSIHQNQSI